MFDTNFVLKDLKLELAVGKVSFGEVLLLGVLFMVSLYRNVFYRQLEQYRSAIRVNL